MEPLDYIGIAFIAFMVTVMTTALMDETSIRDSIAVTNGLMALQEAGRGDN